MRIARLAGVVVVVVLVLGLVEVSAAFAAGPLFLGAKPNPFTTSSGVSTWAAPAAEMEITCESDSSGGEIVSTTLAGNIHVHFLGCQASKGTEKCSVMSSGAPLENLIFTNTLHGVLGLVLPKPATGSDVGLLLLPSSGRAFFNMLGQCLLGGTAGTAMEGSIAGLVEPVGSLVLAGTIKFQTTNKKQAIKDIDLTNGPLVEPEFVGFTVTWSVTTNEAVVFAKDVEVV